MHAVPVATQFSMRDLLCPHLCVCECLWDRHDMRHEKYTIIHNEALIHVSKDAVTTSLRAKQLNMHHITPLVYKSQLRPTLNLE